MTPQEIYHKIKTDFTYAFRRSDWKYLEEERIKDLVLIEEYAKNKVDEIIDEFISKLANKLYNNEIDTTNYEDIQNQLYKLLKD